MQASDDTYPVEFMITPNQDALLLILPEDKKPLLKLI